MIREGNMSVKYWWNEKREEKTEAIGENKISQCQIVHRKCHVDWCGIERGLQISVKVPKVK
jgi:hypothetical protein